MKFIKQNREILKATATATIFGLAVGYLAYEHYESTVPELPILIGDIPTTYSGPVMTYQYSEQERQAMLKEARKNPDAYIKEKQQKRLISAFAIALLLGGALFAGDLNTLEQRRASKKHKPK